MTSQEAANTKNAVKMNSKLNEVKMVGSLKTELLRCQTSKRVTQDFMKKRIKG